MRFSNLLWIGCLLIFASCKVQQKVAADKGPKNKIWTNARATKWYHEQEWIVGANFLPSTAINQLEMWQADSFDTLTIDRELGLAQELGMNTMRVFLHDLAFQQDPDGFLKRVDKFLSIAGKHKIRPMFVFFDSCWDPFPHTGVQRAPKPYVHNSGWVQSPGQNALKDSTQYRRLQVYVTATVKHFANDKRIMAWDVWNEPDNMTGPSYEKVELPNKVALVIPLLERAFAWVRAMEPIQPLTSGIWAGDWSSDEKLKPVERLQLQLSDIITFHNYDQPKEFERRINYLQRYGKPLICTEYMARPNGSTFATFLPIAKKYRVGMYNWGFVNGKSQTIYPWDSWTRTYFSPPPVWFHDLFNTDGSPYRPEEIDVIKNLIQGK